MYRHNVKYFENLTLENCYWAGLIAADGNLNIDRKTRFRLTIVLKKSDAHHLSNFNKAIEFDGPVRPVFRKYKYKGLLQILEYGSVCIHGAKNIFKDLDNLFNIVPRKSLVLKPPNIADLQLNLSYFKGFYDGDGSTDWRRKNPRLAVLGTPLFLEWCRGLLSNITNLNDVPINKTRTKAYLFRFGGNKAATVVAELNKLRVPYLKRKWERQ